MAGTPDDLADVWARLLSLFVAKRDTMFATMSELGLTPPHAHALSVLSDGPVRMRDMAERMMYDASYITAVVDRLEQLGLAERRAGSNDRRVKEIALTDKGREASARIGAIMTSAPDELTRLSKADRATLAALVSKAVPVAPPSRVDPFKPGPRG
jgi:DNA-binding MarR family transcriptional regulator